MTQKLLMMSLVLPQHKVLSLFLASTIMHGAGQTANMKRGYLQKLLGISNIMQRLSLLRSVKVMVGMDKAIFAIQYVGQEVELATMVEMVEAGRLWEDLESGESLDRIDTVNTEEYRRVIMTVKFS